MEKPKTHLLRDWIAYLTQRIFNNAMQNADLMSKVVLVIPTTDDKLDHWHNNLRSVFVMQSVMYQILLSRGDVPYSVEHEGNFRFRLDYSIREGGVIQLKEIDTIVQIKDDSGGVSSAEIARLVLLCDLYEMKG